MKGSTRGVMNIEPDANARVGRDLSRPPPSPNPGGDGTLEKVFPAADGFLRGGEIPTVEARECGRRTISANARVSAGQGSVTLRCVSWFTRARCRDVTSGAAGSPRGDAVAVA